MKNPITYSYRAQILKANVDIIKRLGPSVIKPSQRDEMVRVMEDIVDRLKASLTTEKAA